jgi:hypothetical protein
VHIHEVIEKASGKVFRCSLSGVASDRWLEVPAWMFDRAASATWRVGTIPHACGAALQALAMLLREVPLAVDGLDHKKRRSFHG